MFLAGGRAPRGVGVNNHVVIIAVPAAVALAVIGLVAAYLKRGHK